MKAGKVGPVPPHLRDAHYAGAKKIGHGSSYQYSHNDPRGVLPQQYAPDVIDGTDYYKPTRRGGEAAYADRVAAIRKILSDRNESYCGARRRFQPGGDDGGLGGVCGAVC